MGPCSNLPQDLAPPDIQTSVVWSGMPQGKETSFSMMETSFSVPATLGPKTLNKTTTAYHWNMADSMDSSSVEATNYRRSL